MLTTNNYLQLLRRICKCIVLHLHSAGACFSALKTAMKHICHRVRISKHFIGGDKRLTNCESLSQHIKNKSSTHNDISIQKERNPFMLFWH